MEERVNYIEGAVDTVVYQNEENGYTVLRLDVGGEEPVTVVGCIPGVAPERACGRRGAGRGTPPTASNSRPRWPAGACPRERRPSSTIWPPAR